MEGKFLNSEEKQKCFDAFIEEYKEKSLVEKQKTLISDYKELIALLQQLCIMHRIDYELLVNKEILNINNKNYTEEDFVDAIYVYTQMLKDILSAFLLQTMPDDESNN